MAVKQVHIHADSLLRVTKRSSASAPRDLRGTGAFFSIRIQGYYIILYQSCVNLSCLFCRVAFLFCNFFQLWRIESENFGNLKGIKTDSGGNNDEKSIFTIRSGTGAGPAAAI